MPSGRTHDRITIYSIFPMAIGVAIATQSVVQVLLFSGGFLFSGWMFGPDLDIYSLPYKRWGPLRWIWIPYQRAMAHRSMLSHGPIVGTAIRLLYLSTWLLGFTALSIICWTQLQTPQHWKSLSLMQLEWLLHQVYHQLKLYPIETLVILLGLELGAMSHALSDWSSTAMRRWRKRRLKRIATKRRK